MNKMNFNTNNFVNREKRYLMRYFARRVLYTIAGKVEKSLTGKKKFF